VMPVTSSPHPSAPASLSAVNPCAKARFMPPPLTTRPSRPHPSTTELPMLLSPALPLLLCREEKKKQK
jgi:hypothetical protein